MRTIAFAVLCALLLGAEQPLPPVKPKAKPLPPVVRKAAPPKEEPRPTTGLLVLVLIGLAGVATGAWLTRSPAPRANGSPESDETQPRSL